MSKLKNNNDVKADKDHIYYNLTFINTNSTILPAEASETRTSKILDKASDFLMSVIRFDIDSHTLPINILKMQPGSKTNTTSFITLKYLGNYYTQNVVYVEYSLTPSNFKLDRQAIYNYQSMLDFINTAISLAFTASGAVGFSPVYIYNPITKLIDLYVDANFLPSAVNKIELFINHDLYLYLTNFQYQFNTQVSLNPLYAFKVDITNDNTLLIPAVGSRSGFPIAVQLSAGPLYLCSQYSSGTASWNSVRGIVLQSNLLPSRKESVPTNSEISQNFSSENTLPIISDFLIPLEDDVTNSRVVLEYLPTAQYRYVDLLSDTPLTQVDFKIYWSDFLGNLYPVYLFPNTGMSIKILFERK